MDIPVIKASNSYKITQPFISQEMCKYMYVNKANMFLSIKFHKPIVCWVPLLERALIKVSVHNHTEVHPPQ